MQFQPVLRAKIHSAWCKLVLVHFRPPNIECSILLFALVHTTMLLRINASRKIYIIIEKGSCKNLLDTNITYSFR